MSTSLQVVQHNNAEIVERMVAAGDISKMDPGDRVRYYAAVCNSIGLNPLTRPFEYITLNGKLTLYARKDATDQLRSLKNVSIQITSRERLEDVYVVTARATTKDGRHDESIGAVTIAGLKGDGLANALMKAETKAKRRVTLSICGLGVLDESELETIPDAARVAFNETGDNLQQSKAAPKPQPAVEQKQAAVATRKDRMIAKVISLLSKLNDATNGNIPAAWIEMDLNSMSEDQLESTGKEIKTALDNALNPVVEAEQPVVEPAQNLTEPVAEQANKLRGKIVDLHAAVKELRKGTQPLPDLDLLTFKDLSELHDEYLGTFQMLQAQGGGKKGK